MDEISAQTSKLFISKGTVEPKQKKDESFIIPTKHEVAEIDGIPTEIVIHVYSNRIFITITQTSKLGSIVSNLI